MMPFLKGFLLGMALQLSVGPVFFALLHKSLREGFREAFKMTLGVALVDAFYIALSFTAVSGLLAQGSHFNIVLRWGGAAILIFFGWGYFKRAGESKAPLKKRIVSGSFAYGIKLTLINPLSIVFWTGTFGSVVASGYVSGGSGILLYGGGCVAATLFFLTMTSFFGSKVQGILTSGLLKKMDFMVGAFLILFGIGLLLK